MKSKRKEKIKDRNKLIVGGIFIAIILIIIIMSWIQEESGMNPSGTAPTPMQQGNMMQPQVEKTATLRLEQQGTDNAVNVIVDAGKAPISAAQLQISYDPRVLTNVSIEKGSFFTAPMELQNKIDSLNGIINYAVGITPTNQPQPGTGVVAVIRYATNPGLTSKTHMTFLPGTKVTVEGINQSVLQEPLGIDLNISQ